MCEGAINKERQHTQPKQSTDPLPHQHHNDMYTLHHTHDQDMTSNNGRSGRIWKRWSDMEQGKAKQDSWNALRWERESSTYQPRQEDIDAACSFRGKVDPRLQWAMEQGTFSNVTRTMAATDIANQWSSKTQSDKKRAVKAMMSFLRATGRKDKYFPEHTEPSTSPIDEERVLTEFALMRCLAGSGTAGAGAMVSHVRTWTRVFLDREFGKKGNKQRGSLSTTSQALKSISKYFDKETKVEKMRKPFDWKMIEMLYKEGCRVNKMDTGVAIAVAFAGLFRMGELTNTASGPFDETMELTEDNVLFLPTFWTATRVQINIGKSKADQEGKKDEWRPRVLPVEENSPGMWLKRMLLERWNLPQGMEPIRRKSPLFMKTNGNHLSQDGVLRFIRQTLAKAGYTMEQQKEYGTHSCRIGGATQLFKMGAGMEVVRELGGWASDTHKIYVRMQRDHLMKFTQSICKA